MTGHGTGFIHDKGGTMYHIAICDDLPEHRAALRDAVSAAVMEENCKLQLYGGIKELIDDCVSGQNCDILLLDIRMPEQDGISVAHEVNRISPATQIIFISAYPGYALEVYETEHLYFLKKPIRPDKLRLALIRAIENIRRQKDVRVVLPLRSGTQHILYLREILYFERQNHVTHAVFDGGVLDGTLKLSEIEPLLPPDAFARPHNSYLVNLSRVRSASRAWIVLDEGSKLPISNLRRAAFRDALARSI